MTTDGLARARGFDLGNDEQGQLEDRQDNDIRNQQLPTSDQATLDERIDEIIVGLTSWHNPKLLITKSEAKAALQALIREAERGARIDEVKGSEKTMIAEFETLCERVRAEPNFGNSTKGKKDNFLDGAESMLTTAQYQCHIRVAALSATNKERDGTN